MQNTFCMLGLSFTAVTKTNEIITMHMQTRPFGFLVNRLFTVTLWLWNVQLTITWPVLLQSSMQVYFGKQVGEHHFGRLGERQNGILESGSEAKCKYWSKGRGRGEGGRKFFSLLLSSHLPTFPKITSWQIYSIEAMKSFSSNFLLTVADCTELTCLQEFYFLWKLLAFSADWSNLWHDLHVNMSFAK